MRAPTNTLKNTMTHSFSPSEKLDEQQLKMPPPTKKGKGKGKGWGHYILSLLHLETLFIIGVIIVGIYLIWFSKDKEGDLERIGFAPNWSALKKPFSKVPSSFIKKKKKKRVYVYEERCREIFEDIFGVKFKSVRPDWLENPATGCNLELDGYNADIKTKLGYGLAFERDGEQHSMYVRRFHRGGPDEFIYQTKKDQWKDMRCKEEGVMLIRIPWHVEYNDLERYIKTKLKREGFGDLVGDVAPGVFLTKGMYS